MHVGRPSRNIFPMLNWMPVSLCPIMSMESSASTVGAKHLADQMLRPYHHTEPNRVLWDQSSRISNPFPPAKSIRFGMPQSHLCGSVIITNISSEMKMIYPEYAVISWRTQPDGQRMKTIQTVWALRESPIAPYCKQGYNQSNVGALREMPLSKILGRRALLWESQA